MIARTPESCPQRLAGHSATLAECGIIKCLLDSDLPESSLVDQDACRACCRSFMPTASDLNPVVASLVWSRTSSALSTIDFSGDQERKEKLTLLNARAEENLPLLFPNEEDLPQAPVDSGSNCSLAATRMHEAIPGLTSVGSQITNWAVGVTTAPRRLPTLQESLASMASAGWRTVHLFVDGEVILPESAGAHPQIHRIERLGAWKNYYESLAALYEIYDAQYLMLVQDDAWWPSHLPVREYLEQLAWPCSDRFIISAYCCSLDVGRTDGWRKYEDVWKYGALAMIFSRTAAGEFLNDHRVRGFGASQKGGIDSIIGDWARRAQVPIFVPTPSLVQHIGDVSTLWQTSRAVGMRRASRFIGDELVAPTVD